jgi:predicted RNA methylase
MDRNAGKDASGGLVMDKSVFRVSFPAGFRPLVERLVERDYGRNSVLGGDESALLVEIQGNFKFSAYFQGAALVLDSVATTGLEEAFRQFSLGLNQTEPKRAMIRVARDKLFARGGRLETFALRGFIRNEPSFPGATARETLEAAVSRLTGLRPESERPDVELSVALRDDGRAYFTAAARFPAPKIGRDAGSLPAATARLLCELSMAGPEDVFLDPFAGSGSIPLERALMSPYKMIFTGDIDTVKVAELKEKLKDPVFKRKARSIFPKVLDARDLSRFEDALFDTIVSDPPWGDWEGLSDEELVQLYAVFLKGAHRVLKPGGRLVLLSGRTNALERARDLAFPDADAWRIREEFLVLVSGKKARALRWERA